MDEATSAQSNKNDGKVDSEQTADIESSFASREICTNTIDLNVEINTSEIETPTSFNLESAATSYAYESSTTAGVNTSQNSLPLLFISKPASVITSQPLPRIRSDLPSPASVLSGQPQTLFLQALAKVNESSLSSAIMTHFRNSLQMPDNAGRTVFRKATELSPPDSLASAPPSYSFVLRQMAIRRRPRIVGTFIPSPSFVQHTPPPNYAAGFDIYVDNPIPPPPPRVYNFGFASMPVVCPDCGYTGMTMVTSKITICTHLCAIVLCVLCCWICAPLPYILRSCKDVYHYCRNCRNFLGMYCPTNPDNTFT